MKLKFVLALPAIALLHACTSDLADVTVTYTKGTPIYGDLEAIRSTPFKGEIIPIENPGKIFVATDYLLIGEENKGIHVIDNTNPESPVAAAFINIPGNKEFFFKDGMVYAESYYDMIKLDLSDPQNPVLVSRIYGGIAEEIKNPDGDALLGFDLETVTEKLDKDDDIYEALGVSQYVLYDYNNNLIPPSVVPASFAGNSTSEVGSVNRIVAHEGYVYAVSRANLLVFNDQEGMERVYSSSLNWAGNMETVFPLEDYLFIGATNQMMIMDISDPERPQRESNFWHATSCDPVYPTSNAVAYVTLRTGDFAECPGDVNALVVLDISDVRRPLVAQEIEMESPYGLTLIGSRLYVGEGENGMRIFDASTPDQLELISWETGIKAYDVLAHPSRPDFILIAGTEGLSQFRIGDQYEHLSTLAY